MQVEKVSVDNNKTKTQEGITHKTTSLLYWKNIFNFYRKPEKKTVENEK